MTEMAADPSSVPIYPAQSDMQPNARRLLVFVRAAGRVRALCEGETVADRETVADSQSALLVRELSHSRVYYFPREDVRLDLLVGVAQTSHCPRKGDASYFAFRAADGPVVAWSYEDPIEKAMPLGGYVAFYEDHVTLDIEG